RLLLPALGGTSDSRAQAAAVPTRHSDPQRVIKRVLPAIEQSAITRTADAISRGTGNSRTNAASASHLRTADGARDSSHLLQSSQPQTCRGQKIPPFIRPGSARRGLADGLQLFSDQTLRRSGEEGYFGRFRGPPGPHEPRKQPGQRLCEGLGALR